MEVTELGVSKLIDKHSTGRAEQNHGKFQVFGSSGRYSEIHLPNEKEEKYYSYVRSRVTINLHFFKVD